METRHRSIYPDPNGFPSMHAEAGIPPGSPVPLRYLEDLVARALRRIRALGGEMKTEEDKARVQREMDSAKVWGAETLRIGYEDELTNVDQMQDELSQWRSLAQQARSFVNASGEPTASREQLVEFLAKMTALGGNPIYINPEEASPAPAAPPATPHKPDEQATPIDDRRAQFMAWFKESGFELPGDEIELWHESKRWFLPTSQIEEWLGAEIGSIDRVATERGLS
jgi:hypothetical protein